MFLLNSEGPVVCAFTFDSFRFLSGDFHISPVLNITMYVISHNEI